MSTLVYILLSLFIFSVGMLFLLSVHGNNFKDEDDDSTYPD